MASSVNKPKGLVIVVSDALGGTACDVVVAASGQFSPGAVEIKRLPHVERASQVETFVAPFIEERRDVAVFHTLVNNRLRAQVLDVLSKFHVQSIDLIGPAISVLSSLTHEEPHGVAGAIHATDETYFRRIEAMEYFVEHDDGRNSENLKDADIVLLGVSRTSKTPLSMYLAFQGYKVANIPLAPGLKPPENIEALDPAKIFGLVSDPETIAKIRDDRLGSDLARAVAGSYASKEQVEDEMIDARRFMKRLGCFTINTNGKSIEESASEIIAHIETIKVARSRSNAKSDKTIQHLYQHTQHIS